MFLGKVSVKANRNITRLSSREEKEWIRVPLKHFLYSRFEFCEMDALFAIVQHGNNSFKAAKNFIEDFVFVGQDKMLRWSLCKGVETLKGGPLFDLSLSFDR